MLDCGNKSGLGGLKDCFVGLMGRWFKSRKPQVVGLLDVGSLLVLMLLLLALGKSVRWLDCPFLFSVRVCGVESLTWCEVVLHQGRFAQPC